MFKPILSILLFTLSFICPIFSRAQMPLWNINIGSNTNDIGFACKRTPNGNVHVAGKFTGTMDLDSGVGTYNIISKGLDDIFLACYTSSVATN